MYSKKNLNIKVGDYVYLKPTTIGHYLMEAHGCFGQIKKILSEDPNWDCEVHFFNPELITAPVPLNQSAMKEDLLLTKVTKIYLKIKHKI